MSSGQDVGMKTFTGKVKRRRGGTGEDKRSHSKSPGRTQEKTPKKEIGCLQEYRMPNKSKFQETLHSVSIRSILSILGMKGHPGPLQIAKSADIQIPYKNGVIFTHNLHTLSMYFTTSLDYLCNLSTK